MTYIALRLPDPRVSIRVEVCQGFPGSDEPFPALIQRLHPVAAINGAYFSKSTKLPIGDIVQDGRMLYSGRMGTALAVSPDGIPTIRRVVWGHAADWGGAKTVLACGPALVLNSRIDVQPELEGFHDPHVMGTTPRMALGYTADNHLLLVKMGSVTFAREALVMKTLGCVGALNLDAGASLSMFYRGKYLETPGRRLTNILCVYERK
ncbi:MAG: phosphodiester glycosidase family protein [Armatimonadota bacterium]|nr:phosphodiester glycosidase family protein [Armatimonadota bacterium]